MTHKQAVQVKTYEPKSRWVCSECGTEHEFKDLIMADNGFDYTYSCKNCGDVIESNGRYYGKQANP